MPCLSEINLSLYTYRCQITEIIDGDSVWGLLDRGFGDHSLRELRLNRIDAWEPKGIERPLGYIAKEFLEEYMPVGSSVIIQSKGFDSFGRLICELWLEREECWVNLGDLLVEKGHAVYRDYRALKRRSFKRLALTALATILGEK